MEKDYVLRIQKVNEHINNVQRNCYKLGMKLIELDNHEFGRILISNGQIHDNSKFRGLEFEHLFTGKVLLEESIKQHRSVNPHHPEYWGGIGNMPNIYLAEMVCDCLARSQEFGTDIKEWIKNMATKKYGFTEEGDTYKTMMYYLDLLLEKSF